MADNITALREKWVSGDQPEPVDIFANAEPPALPSGLLPAVVEDFANVQGEMMGADPSGLAMAALTVCSAAITDNVQVQPKTHEPHWTESPRIWTALIGDPSTKKSPIIRAAARPITKIDAKMFQEWQRQMADYNALPKEERKGKDQPPQKRKRIEDVTIEAAQDVLKDNPEGVMCLQDELSGWFGSMDKYNGGKGSAKDRGFWLQAYNGGGYALSRVGRGSAFIPNLSVSVLGGIQPSPIRRVARDAVDDGLLQRLLPIVLRPADVGKDEAPPRDVVGEFEALVAKLSRRMEPQRAGFDGGPEPCPIRLDEGAQAIRRDLEHRHLRLVQLEGFNAKLGAHFGKYDGLFARLCILFHAIENADADTLPLDVSEDTASRVRDFLHGFLRQHALSFYHGTLTLEDSHDQLTAVAGYVLAHGLDRITARDVQRGNRTMRSMSKDDVSDVMDRLELMGWVTPADAHRSNSRAWDVNPLVHDRFAARAERERQRRQEINQMLQDIGAS